jgi:hypothetical protein
MNTYSDIANSLSVDAATTRTDKTRLKLVRETVSNLTVRSGLRAGEKCLTVGESGGGCGASF